MFLNRLSVLSKRGLSAAWLKLMSSKVPPFSTEDYHKRLQKIAVLYVNVEVNLILCEWNHSTTDSKPGTGTGWWYQPIYQEAKGLWAINRLVVLPGTVLVQSQSVNHVPGKWEGKLTGRTQHPQICDATGWPAVASKHHQPLCKGRSDSGQLWREVTQEYQTSPTNEVCNWRTDLLRGCRILDPDLMRRLD